MNPSSRALALAVLLAAACAPRFDPHLVNVPIAGPGGRQWVTTEQVGHPLVGKIWDVKAGRFVDEATLDAAVTGADFVALGEVHDNPDHHLLQARLVRAITAAGKRPALGFEMLDADQQPAVDASLAKAPKDADALGTAVNWKESRWPDWAWYRPIFEAGLEAGLPIVAANLPRGLTKDIRTKGKDALDEQLQIRLAREEPIPPKTLAALREEMAESHCGALPESLIDPLVLVQRARDAQMAWRVESAGGDRGGILISGKGHARTDRAVPAIVAKDAPGKKIVAVAFTEAQAGETDPAKYHEEEGATGPAPYDFLVFTPGAKREDPCEGMRKHMAKKKAAEAKGGQAAPGGMGGSDAAKEPPKAPPAAPPAQ
jgi:uncharacterized iron-regulated protein